MTDLVETYRRNHIKRPPVTRSRWSLALAGLGGLIVIGMVGLQLTLLVTLGLPKGPATRQESTLGLRPPISVEGGTADVSTTGSLIPLKLEAKPTGEAAGLRNWLFILGIGGLSGLFVFTGLSWFVPAREHAEESEQPTPGPAVPHQIGDRAEDRRYHGGPIRN